MAEISKFISMFLGSPLYLVLILLFIGVVLYWFIKERPQEKKRTEDLIEAIRNESKVERENFFTMMDNFRADNVKVATLYDKALENSTHAIENNTEVIKNNNSYLQLINKQLEYLTNSATSVEESLEEFRRSNSELKEKINEAIIIIRNNN